MGAKLMRNLMTIMEAASTVAPLAVIIKGNPKYIRRPEMRSLAEAFYSRIKHLLVNKGFRVEFDPGKAYTAPDSDASVWIGHSRGIDRLRFAPKHVQILALKTKDHDKHHDSKEAQGLDPLHYELSDADIAAIQALHVGPKPSSK